jgi:hypothetical protein
MVAIVGAGATGEAAIAPATEPINISLFIETLSRLSFAGTVSSCDLGCWR